MKNGSKFSLALNRKVNNMKTEQEYSRDLTEIRSMMERSTKFLSLSGLSGIMAGIYALVGASFAYRFVAAGGHVVVYHDERKVAGTVWDFIILGVVILVLAVGTAI